MKETEQAVINALIDSRLQHNYDVLAIAIDKEQNDLENIQWEYISGNRNSLYKKIDLKVGDGIAGLVWKSKEAMVVQNIKIEAEELLEQCPIVKTENLTSIIAVPIIEQESILGVLLCGYRKIKKIKEIDLDVMNNLSKEYMSNFNLLKI